VLLQTLDTKVFDEEGGDVRDVLLGGIAILLHENEELQERQLNR
jgi:hypothetical protein